MYIQIAEQVEKYEGNPAMRVTYAIPFLLLPLTGLIGQDAVAPSATEIQPILVGSTIPEVTLTDVNNQSFDLMEAVKSKSTILVYYRGSW